MPSYWDPFLPDEWLQLDPEWQRALSDLSLNKNPDRYIAYLREHQKLTARQCQELADLEERRRIRPGAEGRRRGRKPVHDELYRLRTDIITLTEAGLQIMRQEYHGKLPHGGIGAVFDPIFDFFIQAYDHVLTPEEVAKLKADCLAELKD